jgi:5-deoxy-glucuronate isomerase
VIRKRGAAPSLGYTSIVELDDFTDVAGIAGGGQGIGFGILRLRRGDEYRDPAGVERCFVLLSGSVRFEWKDGSFAAERESLVDEAPSSLDVGAADEVRVSAVSDRVELAVFRADNARPLPVIPVRPSDVRIATLTPANLDGSADRVIRTVLDDTNAPGSAMTLGEVVNRPGRWSSFPPHHHRQVELYHYRFFPAGGFGYCGLGEAVFKVRDGDTVVIPPGLTHPQVAAPGCAMIYLWGIRHLEGERFGGASRIYPAEFDWAMP